MESLHSRKILIYSIVDRSAADAEAWCIQTTCPPASSASETNCCVWHVNVHSCPLEDTVNGLCGPWILPSGGTFTHSEVLGNDLSILCCLKFCFCSKLLVNKIFIMYDYALKTSAALCYHEPNSLCHVFEYMPHLKGAALMIVNPVSNKRDACKCKI